MIKLLLPKNEIEDINVLNEVNLTKLQQLGGNKDYYQIFINNLNEDNNLTLDDITKMKTKELFDKFIDIHQELNQNLYLCFSYMRYDIQFPVGELNKVTYVNKLINYIENNIGFKKKY